MFDPETDKSLLGAPPQPGEFVQGMLQLHVYLLGSDATDMTVAVDAYSFTPPHAIDWGDGTWEDATTFVATAGAANEPNVYTADHQYTGAGIRRGYVENGIRARFNADVGKVRVLDPENRNKTVTQLQTEARTRDRDTRRTQRWREGRVS